MHLSSHLYRKVLVLMVGALVISALAAGPALAKGKTAKPTGGEQCWVTPNPVVSGLVYSVWGSGFPAGMLITVQVKSASGTAVLMGLVGTDGIFSTAANAMFLGTADVYIFSALDRHMTVWCHTTFDSVS